MTGAMKLKYLFRFLACDNLDPMVGVSARDRRIDRARKEKSKKAKNEGESKQAMPKKMTQRKRM